MGDRSPFGASWSPVVELFYSGAWQDVSAYLGDAGVTITRGREDEQSQPGPSSCTLVLDNADGRFSPRNPSSPLFGLIGRNTAVRVSTVVGGTTYRRFWGEVSEWPVQWTRKGTATVTLKCSGVMRRLSQGASPLYLPLRRALSAIGSGLVAYWPMEDGSDATRFAEHSGSASATWTGTPSLAAYEGFTGSEPLPEIGTGVITIIPPVYSGSTQVRWFTVMPTSTPHNAVLLRLYFSGSIGWVDVIYVTGGSLFVNSYNDSGALVSSVGPFAWSINGNMRIRMSIDFVQSGSDVVVTMNMYEQGASFGFTNALTLAGYTAGRVTKMVANPSGVDLGGMPFGHLTLEKTITTLFDVSSAVMSGYRGERAHDRIERIGAENGITVSMTTGDVGGITVMGQQRAGTVLDVMRAAAEADGGILFERRTSSSLGYRSLEAMYSSIPTVTIPYIDNLVQMEPTDDDQAVRNRVTVSRPDGSAFIAEKSSGPLGTATVGLYDDSLTLQVDSDVACKGQAQWRVHVGTWDEARYPRIGVDLAHPTFLADAALTAGVLNVDVGHTVKVTNPPAWLPPFPILAIVQGYTEEIGTHRWKIEWNAIPGQPYRVAKYGDTRDRYSAEGTVTAEDLTTTETGVDITPPVGAQWGHGNGDYDIVIGGEQMTVTAVTALSGGNQTMTVVRSVNGVVKAHAAGAAVSLADPCFYER